MSVKETPEIRMFRTLLTILFTPAVTTVLSNVWYLLNTLKPRQNGRHFPDNIFKCILLNENVWISLKISLKFVPQGPITNIPALVPMMAWRRPGDKPLSGPMMVKLPTHICVTRPQWVKSTILDTGLSSAINNEQVPKISPIKWG